MESCQYLHSHVLDVHISVHCLCINFLSCVSKNWSFIFWCSYLYRTSSSFSIQVNFPTQIINKNIDSRIPLLRDSRFPQFGYSSKMILLIWCVWGGFLLHILECNYLTVLVKPVYEKPIDTAEDIIERGITIIDFPGRKSMVNMLKKSPFQITRALAESTYVSKVFI